MVSGGSAGGLTGVVSEVGPAVDSVGSGGVASGLVWRRSILPRESWWMDLAIAVLKLSEVGASSARIPWAQRAVRKDTRIRGKARSGLTRELLDFLIISATMATAAAARKE